MARRKRGRGGVEQFKATYFTECSERLETMERVLQELGEGADEPLERFNELFRAVHSIKGGAGAFGLEAIVALTHTFETLLDRLRGGDLEAGASVLDVLVLASDALAHLVEMERDGGKPDPGRVADAAAALEKTLSGEAVATETKGAPRRQEQQASPPGPRTVRIRFEPNPDLFRSANDPILIARELRTLGELEIRPDVAHLPSLDEMDPNQCYMAWDYALSTDRPESDIREVFEFVEDDCRLEIVDEGVAPNAEPEARQKAEAPAPSLPAEKPAPKPAPPAIPTPPAAAPPAMQDPNAKSGLPAAATTSIRVDLGRVDSLVNMVGELVITQSVLEQHLGDIHIEDDATVQGLEAITTHIRELQENVMAIRMQPVQSVFVRIPRLVRELSRSLGKKARLVTTGEQTEVDKTIVEQLSDPLTHMIRNALDHGIETPEERLRQGKPEEATVHLAAAHRSGRITIEVSDDGRGIDKEVVHQRAIERGLIDPDVPLRDEEIYDLIFAPGFSTAAAVTDVSGRGVGMDVVRRSIQSIGGRVIVESQLGRGSRFVMSLPLTLAVMDGMIVRVGAERYVLPLGCIIESASPTAEALSEIAGRERLIMFRGEYVPLVFLHRLFSVACAVDEPEGALVVYVETDTGAVIGIVVDEVLEQRQVVIKSLEENFRPVPGVSAATILGDGQVALILEVNALFAMYKAQGRVSLLGSPNPASPQIGDLSP